jgi:hypothetical protein
MQFIEVNYMTPELTAAVAAHPEIRALHDVLVNALRQVKATYDATTKDGVIHVAPDAYGSLTIEKRHELTVVTLTEPDGNTLYGDGPVREDQLVIAWRTSVAVSTDHRKVINEFTDVMKSEVGLNSRFYDQYEDLWRVTEMDELGVTMHLILINDPEDSYKYACVGWGDLRANYKAADHGAYDYIDPAQR